MLDLYYWPTPNGHKITLLLEELVDAGQPLPYRIKPVNIGKGEQFESAFLAIAPNNKMPAIVDHAPADGGAAISVFESGAILQYLAEKTGHFLPEDARARIVAMEWLYWQVAGLGPMTGQYGHFHVYAPDRIPYAMERYALEAERLIGVLDTHLAGRRYIAGDDYSIADMACYPWINPYKSAPMDLSTFPQVQRWHAAIKSRPATVRAYALSQQVNPSTGQPLTDEDRRHLFGQGAKRQQS